MTGIARAGGVRDTEIPHASSAVGGGGSGGAGGRDGFGDEDRYPGAAATLCGIGLAKLPERRGHEDR